MPLEHRRDLAQRRIFCGRNDICRHDLLNAPAVRLGEFLRKFASRRHRFKPPRPLLFRADLLPMQQVGFADDTDHIAAVVDDRERADIVFAEKPYRFGDVIFRLHRDNVANHDVQRFHVALPRARLFTGAVANKNSFGYVRMTS